MTDQNAKKAGRPNRIDLKRLSNMKRQGVSDTECAKFFKVSPSAVYQARRKLNLAIAKVGSLEKANEIIVEGIDSMRELRRINSETNRLIDLLSGWVSGDPAAIKKLERQHRLLRVGSKKGAVNAVSVKDPRELLLKSIQEIRQQVALSLQIMQSLYDMKATAEFQRVVISVIGEADPATRDRIIKLLQQQQHLRGSLRA